MARPRSARAHDQVLDAALRLFAVRGLDGTSMDAIAELSGVSKATIYKHWPDKDALCLEVMARFHLREDPRPAADSGDVRADIVAALSQQPPHKYPDHPPGVAAHSRAVELAMRMRMHLMAYAARNPAFGKAWRARVFDPPRAELTRLLERAVAEGLLPRQLDRGLAVALLFGPMMYRHVLSLVHVEVPENLAEQVVDAFWKAHALARPARRARSTRTPTSPGRRAAR